MIRTPYAHPSEPLAHFSRNSDFKPSISWNYPPTHPLFSLVGTPFWVGAPFDRKKSAQNRKRNSHLTRTVLS